MAQALKLLHGQPRHGWTVDEIAREVGCSRTLIAERFVQYLGQPPIQYLTKWRLALAASRLRSSHQSLERVAEEVGYVKYPDQKLSVAAPALMRSCMALAPTIVTPEMRSSAA